ncbi:DUF4233 domain-containing protein [Streptomyces aidingensis]|uniref:DUF4233 domain-containing protein n=1 Tax=Streptomyces aidingensis TaxID=910347 RepID=A0A1I1FJ22_9ACTN|nr:DUF4233 domain-containing protein [Streptomyces aidingensis]SFB98986.1 Protein of unknown function [Streptomyces aidingensis]
MRQLCATTLAMEAIVIGLAALVASRMSDLPAGTLWTVSGAAMVLALVLCGLVGRVRGAVSLGWALQAGLVLSGLVVPMMFVLGACFTALWWASVHFGRRVDELKAARAAGGAGGAGGSPGIPAQDAG